MANKINIKTLFSDEKEVYAKMLDDGFSKENALEVISYNRKKLIPSNTTSKADLDVLRGFANDGLTSKEAVKKIFWAKKAKRLCWFTLVQKSMKNCFWCWSLRYFKSYSNGLKYLWLVTEYFHLTKKWYLRANG